MADFDKEYWQNHWSSAASAGEHHLPANPYLMTETAHLPVGTALDAGCGTGTEALWLAEHGWDVTAGDISATALTTARARATAAGLSERIDWVEVDLSRWEPEQTWDLVVTSYAHAKIGQLALYRRIASWVAPGGTVLIVAHLHGRHGDDHPGHDRLGPNPPESATATQEAITKLFSPPQWRVEAGYEHTRVVRSGHSAMQLHDVVVRAHRLY